MVELYKRFGQGFGNVCFVVIVLRKVGVCHQLHGSSIHPVGKSKRYRKLPDVIPMSREIVILKAGG